MWRLRSGGPSAGYCRECGEDAFPISQPGLFERVRHFVCFGMPATGSWSCPNGHEVDGTIGSTRTLKASRLPGRLGVPVEAARMIYHERTVVPVPLTYLVALAVGAVLGAVLDIWLAWRWWLVALGVLAAVWLLFLASAFRADNRRHLFGRLRYLKDPHGQHRRELEEFKSRVNAGAIAAYGVAGWEGPLRLGGWTGRDTEISSLRLVHLTSRDDEMAAVEVEYRSAERHDYRRLHDELLEDFMMQSMELPDSTEPRDLGRRMQQRRWQALQQSPPSWEEASIQVDGMAVAFEILARSDAFVSVAPVGGGYLVVEAHGPEPGSFAIATVDDIGPYVEGTLAAMEAHRREV